MALNRAIFIIAFGSLLIHSIDCSLKNCKSELKGDVTNKVVLITGGNSGIGLETVKQLAFRGATVIMACRNKDKANAEIEKINAAAKEKNKQVNVVYKRLDLADFDGVREFANEFIGKQLNILILNAAAADKWHREDVVLADVKGNVKHHVSKTLYINHFGSFLLTKLLTNELINSAETNNPSRIVVVASKFYHFFDKFIPNKEAHFLGGKLLPPFFDYFISKYQNILFARELAKRLDAKKVTVNALHPGLINTDLWDMGCKFLNVPFYFLSNILLKTTAEGAKTTIYCAVSDDLKETTGKYIRDCHEYHLSKAIENNQKGALKLWELSEEIIQLKKLENNANQGNTATNRIEKKSKRIWPFQKK